MTIRGTFEKQPAEVESYSINYEDDLVDTDAIESALVEVTPVGLTVSCLAVHPRVKVTTSGGTDKTKYKITVTATTFDGRVLQDEIVLKVKDA